MRRGKSRSKEQGEDCGKECGSAEGLTEGDEMGNKGPGGQSSLRAQEIPEKGLGHSPRASLGPCETNVHACVYNECPYRTVDPDTLKTSRGREERGPSPVAFFQCLIVTGRPKNQGLPPNLML